MEQKKMDAKEYLGQVQKCDTHINNMLDEMAQLKAFATKITTTLRPDAAGGSGGGQDKIGNAVAKIVALEEDITKEIDRYIDTKREVGRLIESVENPDQAKVLFKRYIKYEKWEAIALDMGFTYRNICYIHGRALQAVERLLENEKNQ